METDEFIQRLAADAAQRRRPVQPLQARLRRTSLAAGAAVVLMAGVGWGVRPDLATSLVTVAGLAKFGLVLAIALVSFELVSRSAEPGRGILGQGGMLLGALMTIVALAVSVSLVERPSSLNLGDVPLKCLSSIFALALLPLAALLSVLRTGAPTRPGVAGWLAGLLAGAVAAFGFALYCPMDRLADVMLWYPLAIGSIGAVGALVGARVLAW